MNLENYLKTINTLSVYKSIHNKYENYTYSVFFILKSFLLYNKEIILQHNKDKKCQF